MAVGSCLTSGLFAFAVTFCKILIYWTQEGCVNKLCMCLMSCVLWLSPAPWRSERSVCSAPRARSWMSWTQPSSLKPSPARQANQGRSCLVVVLQLCLASCLSTPPLVPDVLGRKLCYTRLCKAMLRPTKLCRTGRCKAMLHHTKLCHRGLCKAMLRHTKLCRTGLCKAMLRHTKLCHTGLCKAILCHTKLCYHRAL